LDADPDLVVVERCLSADTLLEAVLGRRVDAVLGAHDLHRLGRVLPEIESTGIPRVLMVPDPDESRWQPLRGVVLANAVTPEVVQCGLNASCSRPASSGNRRCRPS